MWLWRRLMPLFALALALAGLTTAPAAATHLETHPHDSRIAFGRFDPVIGGYALWTARASGSRQRRLTPGQAYFPSWSTDRTHLLFDFPDARGNEQIARIGRNGFGFEQLTFLPGISEIADYSPNGRKIVFGHSPTLPDQPNFQTSVWVMRADGSNARELIKPAPGTSIGEARLSPNGSKILFASTDVTADPQPVAIFVANADGSNRRQVTSYRLGLEHPQWSPNGRWITYDIEAQIPANGIYVVRPSGAADHRIFESDDLVGFKPDFSPDGRRILFGCFVRAEHQDDLCVMRADGSGAHRIVRTPSAAENFPSWN
jgi:TolB protein